MAGGRGIARKRSMTPPDDKSLSVWERRHPRAQFHWVSSDPLPAGDRLALRGLEDVLEREALDDDDDERLAQSSRRPRMHDTREEACGRRSMVNVWPQIGHCEDIEAMHQRNVRRKKKAVREIRGMSEGNSILEEDDMGLPIKMEGDQSQTRSENGSDLDPKDPFSDDDTIVVAQPRTYSYSSPTPPCLPSTQPGPRKRSRTLSSVKISPIYSLPRIPKRSRSRATSFKKSQGSRHVSTPNYSPSEYHKSFSSPPKTHAKAQALLFRDRPPATNRLRDVFSRSPPQSLRIRDLNLNSDEMKENASQCDETTEDLHARPRLQSLIEDDQQTPTFRGQDIEACELPLQSIENGQSRHREEQLDIFGAPMSSQSLGNESNPALQRYRVEIFDASMSPAQPSPGIDQVLQQSRSDESLRNSFRKG